MIAFKYRNLATALLLLFGCVFTSLPGHAVILNETQKLTASDAALADNFGRSVAVSGDTMVVGVPGDDDTAEDSGSAYVYRFDGNSWIEEQKLTASDAAEADLFGTSAAVSGDTIVIGAIRDDDIAENSGSAYVYRFDGSAWIEEQKLIASDATRLKRFGNSVAVSGDTVVIGAFSDDDTGIRSGSAYVYRFDGNNWIEEQKLTASDAAVYNFFGHSVDLIADTIVIGAPSSDISRVRLGSAYVYRFDGNSWIEAQKLTASDEAMSDDFGLTVSVNGDAIVVGAPGKLADGGAAYIYRFDGNSWIEAQKLTASDAAVGVDVSERFGESVSVSGDTVVIGAGQDSEPSRLSGSAYVYRFDGSLWGQEQKLAASDAMAFDIFGRYVALSGNTVLVGAFPSNDDTAFESGSAYVFSLDNNKNTAPTITSADAATVPENQTSVIDVNANDDSDSEGNGLNYTISGGVDQALFGIEATNGVVTFISAPDFEAPADAGGDNIYNIAVTVTDSSSQSDTQAITITVENEPDGSITKLTAKQGRSGWVNIKGTGESDHVVITGIGPGAIVVSDGANDGASVGTFTGVTGLEVKTRQGADRVTLVSVDIPRSLFLKGGRSNDTIEIAESLRVGGSLFIDLFSGNNLITTTTDDTLIDIGFNARIKTTGGDDTVVLANIKTGNRLTIKAGSGDNTIKLINGDFVKAGFARSGRGMDEYEIKNSVGGSMTIIAGGGIDTVTSDSNTFSNWYRIDCGPAADIFTSTNDQGNPISLWRCDP